MVDATHDTPDNTGIDRKVVLIVDDEPGMIDYVADVVEGMGLSAKRAESAQQFTALYPDVGPDAIIMDIVMPEMDGIELVKWLGERHCPAPVLLISGHDPNYARMLTEMAEIAGVTIAGRLSKPFDIDALEHEIDKLLAAMPASRKRPHGKPS